MQVHIPFMERFREPMLNGQKTWTSRTKQYGKAGDTFDIFGSTFQIEVVMEMRLDTVAWLHSREEGCQNPQEFMQVWAMIHNKRGFVPDDLVWVHQFKKVNK